MGPMKCNSYGRATVKKIRNFTNQFEKARDFRKVITIKYIMEMLWNCPVDRIVEILQKIYQHMCDMFEY